MLSPIVALFARISKPLRLNIRSTGAEVAGGQKTFITAQHGMQTRSSDENSVRPSVRTSVRLSHAWIVTKRKNDLSRFIYHTKDHLG